MTGRFQKVGKSRVGLESARLRGVGARTSCFPTPHTQFHLSCLSELVHAVVIKASTKLADWVPIATNILRSDPIRLSVPQSAQFPQWFPSLPIP